MNYDTLKGTREELKKGCGKETDCYGYPRIKGNGGWKCGEQYLDQEIILCPECKAKLEGCQNQKKEDLKMIDEFSNELKKEIMKIEVEDYGDYSKNKICSCGSHKLSHNPSYIDDKEVCDIISKKVKELKNKLEGKIESLKRYNIKGSLGLKQDKEGIFVFYKEISRIFENQKKEMKE